MRVNARFFAESPRRLRAPAGLAGQSRRPAVLHVRTGPVPRSRTSCSAGRAPSGPESWAGSGTVQRFENLAADRTWQIREDQAEARLAVAKTAAR